ncbi:MAG: hypothetical protein LUF84_08075 [Clostridiales bacterium]|nr:hypothetical protein [Clostridiales bacterium]
MLFRKDIEPRCQYCARGELLKDEQIACPKKGIVSPGYHCFRFQYDPLKRVPPQSAVPDFSKFSDEDFTL